MPYRIAPIARRLVELNLLAPHAVIDWGGGGEPTLMPDFDETFALFEAHGTTQWLHTNAVRIPARAASPGMERSRVRVLCSLDAGTRETYLAIKARDYFELVMQHLATYIRNGAYVAAKYIVTEQNCAIGEIERCLAALAAIGAHEFVPDIDHDAPDPSDEVVRGLAYARRRCAELELPCQIGSTGMNSAREYLVEHRIANEVFRQMLEANSS